MPSCVESKPWFFHGRALIVSSMETMERVWWEPSFPTLLSPPPRACAILSTSLLFTEGAGSCGAGKGCSHHHFFHPGGGGGEWEKDTVSLRKLTTTRMRSQASATQHEGLRIAWTIPLLIGTICDMEFANSWVQFALVRGSCSP